MKKVFLFAAALIMLTNACQKNRIEPGDACTYKGTVEYDCNTTILPENMVIRLADGEGKYLRPVAIDKGVKIPKKLEAGDEIYFNYVPTNEDYNPNPNIVICCFAVPKAKEKVRITCWGKPNKGICGNEPPTDYCSLPATVFYKGTHCKIILELPDGTYITAMGLEDDMLANLNEGMHVTYGLGDPEIIYTVYSTECGGVEAIYKPINCIQPMPD